MGTEVCGGWSVWGVKCVEDVCVGGGLNVKAKLSNWRTNLSYD